MPPEPTTHRAQQLRLFFMAGLTGAADYKNRRQVEEFAAQEAWPSRFEDFFERFTADFKRSVPLARGEEPEANLVRTLPAPDLWRIDNDAVLFTELIFPQDDQRNAGFRTSVRTFVELVRTYVKKYEADGMSVRGCVWTAGFPLRNKSVRIVQSDIPIMDLSESIDEDGEPSGGRRLPLVTPSNFIGRDMDLGFRLMDGCPAGRIVTSLDAANLLTSVENEANPDLTLWHIGWNWLPEILGGVNYPRLFIEPAGAPWPRYPWDDDPDLADADTLDVTSGRAKSLTADTFGDLFTRMREIYPQMIVAYASAKDRPYVHEVRYTTRDVSSLDAIGEEPEYVAPSTAVETIGLDDLNQILLALQEHPEVIPDLRRVLVDIAEHGSYKRWKSEFQYDELLYRLHPELSFQTDSQRRLLETLSLVKRDILRVRLNRCKVNEDRIFMTDGFWVPAGIRVFPDEDESDLVIKRCRELKWMDWATTVIDAATGCGHSLLRYEGDPLVRVGFDRSPRALAYAAINALLNDVENTSIAINDIRKGLPPLFGGADERILITVNMPFALVAKPDTLARTSDGGRYGYEPTEWAFRAIGGLLDRLPASSEVRCVVLVYSVGEVEKGRWMVMDLATRYFGAQSVSWKLWEDERLWRVNGKKEQINPMPLGLLNLKSTCRFHVRRDKDRVGVRADYDALTAELEEKDYDVLGYGAIDLQLRGRAGAAAVAA